VLQRKHRKKTANTPPLAPTIATQDQFVIMANPSWNCGTLQMEIQNKIEKLFSQRVTVRRLMENSSVVDVDYVVSEVFVPNSVVEIVWSPRTSNVGDTAGAVAAVASEQQPPSTPLSSTTNKNHQRSKKRQLNEEANGDHNVTNNRSLSPDLMPPPAKKQKHTVSNHNNKKKRENSQLTSLFATE
jgi:hypothetical protein